MSTLQRAHVLSLLLQVGNCGQVIARPSQVAVTAASSSADLALTPGEATEKEPPFRNSQIPTGDPKSADYKPHVNKMIVKACHHFEALVCTEDAFPDPTVQKDWAIAVWARACQDVRIPYKLTDRVQKLVCCPLCLHRCSALWYPVRSNSYMFLADYRANVTRTRLTQGPHSATYCADLRPLTRDRGRCTQL